MSYDPNAPNRFDVHGSAMFGSEAIELNNPARQGVEETPSPATTTETYVDELGRLTGYAIRDAGGVIIHLAEFDPDSGGVMFVDNFGDDPNL